MAVEIGIEIELRFMYLPITVARQLGANRVKLAVWTRRNRIVLVDSA